MNHHSQQPQAVSVSERLYSMLMRRNLKTEEQMPNDLQARLPSNGLKQVSANALQSSGDQLVNASTVLPWLFAALGVPPALTGVLVPIRESGSMLPQAFLTPLVLRARYRKWIFVAGALVQAGAVAIMAATAAFGEGLVAGLVIVGALALFALGRCLCSISSKDVQGRTIPKGERGQINGLATTAAGVVAITVGLIIRVLGSSDLAADQLAWLLVAGVALWVAVAAIYSGMREPADDAFESSSNTTDDADLKTNNWIRQMVQLLREDKAFRNFVGVRSLLLVSSLSPPFIVALSIQSGAGGLTGLGGFIIASGLAALIGGRLFGRFADRSSKKLMSLGAGVASVVIITTVLLVALLDFTGESWLGNLVFVTAYFAVTLMHTGVRIGRKTYVVDMAQGDQRTVYVAVSNTAMGFILLLVGGLSSLLAMVDIIWALLFLALIGLVGVFAGARLPEVSQG